MALFLENVYAQLTVNLIIYTIVFVLIALFYYIAYRNEQKSSREAVCLWRSICMSDAGADASFNENIPRPEKMLGG